MCPSQGPLPANTQHSQQTDIHDPGGIQTGNPLISRPIHAPSHELEDTDTNTPTRVISKRILVELLGVREESVILYLRGMNLLAHFSLLFYTETWWLHLGV
jgi:hypothetical protein